MKLSLCLPVKKEKLFSVTKYEDITWQTKLCNHCGNKHGKPLDDKCEVVLVSTETDEDGLGEDTGGEIPLSQGGAGSSLGPSETVRKISNAE